MALLGTQLQQLGQTNAAPAPDDWFGQFGGSSGDQLPIQNGGMESMPQIQPSGTTLGSLAGQAGADPWQTFESIVGIGGPGASLSPQMLLAKEQELNAAGIQLIKNAAGQPGKIQYTSGPLAGQSFDVIQGAGAGQDIYQRLPLGGPSSGGNLGALGGFGSLNFNSGSQTFTPPDPNTFFQTPWVQAALNQSQQGIERSAAAKGDLLTGGTLKALQGNALTFGPALYNQAFGQALQGNQANFGNDLQTNQTNYGNLYNLAGLGIKGAGA